ncbi:cytochrome b/b6 domain-containing protein [uncultured Methanobrevibacter sp.]|uniref:cytochrome b/b6 domain-containing protein n=1 Tax=uncultured Methanobrevibacter sp. TaxID=253161 RepID=UPI0025DC7DBE|nr:cytochrome b/b6 domain-containing protein [uncultured Methanobrevibacter sp.]
MNKKITVDVLMFVAIILEFLSLPILIHEIIGMGLAFLIILHINYNKNYFKAIRKGKYNLERIIGLIVNIGLLASLFITIISGIFASQKSLKDLKIGNRKISSLHKPTAVISLIFLVLHLITTRKKLARELKK